MDMKSQMIKIRNLPSFPVVIDSISVKPILTLVLAIFAGILIIVVYPYLSYIGATLVAMATFSMLIMPDRKFMEITSDYAILYNCKDESYCKIVYWDEILSWQYHWHNDYDELIIELCDHSIEKISAYSRRRFTKYFKLYASGKEKKVKR